MNWGKSITVVFVLFAGMIIFMVVRSMQQNFDLVENDYYNVELKYQDQIDASHNAAVYDSLIHLTADTHSVALAFPVAALDQFDTGTVIFYRASDAKLDVKESLALDEQGVQLFDRKRFVKGNYKVKISWVAGGKSFYSEQTLQL